MCRWSLKGLAEQCKSQICFSYGHTMKGLTIISLLLVAIMVSTAAAQGGISSCCQRTSNTQIHRDLLKSYYIQQPPSCSIPAVVFTTISGRRICSDSLKTWTQTSMAYLDGKNWQKRNITAKK
uniref:C-C motif chemokine n=2 Tax=Astatotilapia calliptera TaxID=8154 RepID=A0AAX7U0K2_ASTCA